MHTVYHHVAQFSLLGTVLGVAVIPVVVLGTLFLIVKAFAG